MAKSTNMMVPLALLGLGAAVLLVATSKPASPTAAVPLTSSFQTEIVSVMQALGVDTSGIARGPFTISAVSKATELANRLQAAGYPDAAALIRGYIQAASAYGPLLPG
jgi:hypothetical protein